jgi:hypothetical protein
VDGRSDGSRDGRDSQGAFSAIGASPYLTVAEVAAYLRLKPRTLD